MRVTGEDVCDYRAPESEQEAPMHDVACSGTDDELLGPDDGFPPWLLDAERLLHSSAQVAGKDNAAERMNATNAEAEAQVARRVQAAVVAAVADAERRAEEAAKAAAAETARQVREAVAAAEARARAAAVPAAATAVKKQLPPPAPAAHPPRSMPPPSNAPPPLDASLVKAIDGLVGKQLDALGDNAPKCSGNVPFGVPEGQPPTPQTPPSVLDLIVGQQFDLLSGPSKGDRAGVPSVVPTQQPQETRPAETSVSIQPLQQTRPHASTAPRAPLSPSELAALDPLAATFRRPQAIAPERLSQAPPVSPSGPAEPNVQPLARLSISQAQETTASPLAAGTSPSTTLLVGSLMAVARNRLSEAKAEVEASRPPPPVKKKVVFLSEDDPRPSQPKASPLPPHAQPTVEFPRRAPHAQSAQAMKPSQPPPSLSPQKAVTFKRKWYRSGPRLA